jgi:putative nucleotidyltransferase-like protein
VLRQTRQRAVMAQQLIGNHVRPLIDWSTLIPDEQWAIYDCVIREAKRLQIRFALGGAFALAMHTGCWRNTKDLDLYVLPEDRERMIECLASCGLTDYYENVPYDRWWIYRGTKEGTIVDVIWAMANHWAHVDELWLSGPEVEIRGRRVQFLPAEAILWDKLYIMQRDRCDWPDVMNLLYFTGNYIDWEYLLLRIDDHKPLLAGALTVFRWISPGRAQAFPSWIWEQLELTPPTKGAVPEIDKRRVSLLDTRLWYGPDRQNLRLD